MMLFADTAPHFLSGNQLTTIDFLMMETKFEARSLVRRCIRFVVVLGDGHWPNFR